MPWMQRLLGELNERFSYEHIHVLVGDREIFGPEGDWIERLSSLSGGVPPAAAITYLRAFPAGLREMLRALIYEDLGRGDSVLPVTWAWAPGYDFEVQAWECPGTLGSLGGITVMVRSRYPGDTRANAS